MNKTQEGLYLNLTMNVEEKVYHYIGTNIPSQQIKLSYDYVCVPNTEKVGRATISRSNVSRPLSEGVLVDPKATIMQTTLYAQIFQSL